MANIITELHLEMSDNWYVSKKLNSVGRVGENTVTKLIIEPTEILDNVTYEIEIADASGSKNVAELTIDGTELYLILTANMLTTSGIMKMQVRGLFTDGSIKKSNIFELKVNRSISATEHYEEYAVTIFDQLVNECRDIIEGAESYAVRAETAAVNAEAYSEAASASAATASTASETAQTASTAAVNAATSAETSANTASTSAETATTAANSASTSASNASTSAQTAQSASVTAQSASETAVSASIVATTAQTAAETAASTATTAASNASASATSAATSASNASNSATSASNSATSAAASETNAAASASSASTSAANANTSATNAANSAVAAATSATNAHNSEVNASTSETNASTSAAEAEASAESIAASVAQINENTYRINDLEAIIAGYQQADLPTGAVATVTDGTALLMPSLKVGIEPQQDLHGYDHPWAGGAGKNLFDIDAEYTIGATSYSYELYVKPNTAYTLSSNCPSSSPANLYFNGGSTETNGVGLGYPKTFNSDEDGKLIIYVRYLPSGESINLYTAVKNGQYYIQLEEGSTATSYEPYSNICPISGWTECEVIDDTVYGGFIDWNQIAPTSNLPSITTFSNGVYTLNYTSPSAISRQIIGSATYSANHVIYVDVKFKKTYDNIPTFRLYSPATGLYYGEYINASRTQIFKNESTNIQLWHNYVEADKEYKLDFCYSIIDLTKVFGSTKADEIYAMEQAEAKSGVAYFKSLFYKDYYAYNSGEITNVSAVNGDTDKYRTYTIEFKDGDNPLTVYGGTLDVVNGELMVDRAEVDFGNLYWNYSSDTKLFTASVQGIKSGTYTDTNLLSSIYPVKAMSYSQFDYGMRYNTATSIGVKNPSYTDANSFKTAMNGIQLVYELAEPITYHLTPTQIRTLVGNNNIWADTGNIIEGKYYKSPY